MYLSFRFTATGNSTQAQFILHQKSNSKNHQQKGFDPERKIWDIYRWEERKLPSDWWKNFHFRIINWYIMHCIYLGNLTFWLDLSSNFYIYILKASFPNFPRQSTSSFSNRQPHFFHNKLRVLEECSKTAIPQTDPFSLNDRRATLKFKLVCLFTNKR